MLGGLLVRHLIRRYEQPFICSPDALVSFALFLRDFTSPSFSITFLVLMRMLTDQMISMLAAIPLVFIV